MPTPTQQEYQDFFAAIAVAPKPQPHELHQGTHRLNGLLRKGVEISDETMVRAALAAGASPVALYGDPGYRQTAMHLVRNDRVMRVIGEHLHAAKTAGNPYPMPPVADHTGETVLHRQALFKNEGVIFALVGNLGYVAGQGSPPNYGCLGACQGGRDALLDMAVAKNSEHKLFTDYLAPPKAKSAYPALADCWREMMRLHKPSGQPHAQTAPVAGWSAQGTLELNQRLHQAVRASDVAHVMLALRDGASPTALYTPTPPRGAQTAIHLVRDEAVMKAIGEHMRQSAEAGRPYPMPPPADFTKDTVLHRHAFHDNRKLLDQLLGNLIPGVRGENDRSGILEWCQGGREALFALAALPNHDGKVFTQGLPHWDSARFWRRAIDARVKPTFLGHLQQHEAGGSAPPARQAALGMGGASS